MKLLKEVLQDILLDFPLSVRELLIREGKASEIQSNIQRKGLKKYDQNKKNKADTYQKSN